MFDEFGKPLTKVSPGMPVEIWGFKDMPSAGDEILQVANEVRMGIAVFKWENYQHKGTISSKGPSYIKPSLLQTHNNLYRLETILEWHHTEE